MVRRDILDFRIDVVHGCQLRCIGCPNSLLKPKIQFITKEIFAACLKNMDVKSIHAVRPYVFGEPFLHPELPDLLAMLGEQPWTMKNMEVSTNGMAHNFDMIEELFKKGLVGQLSVSCDGDGTPESYEMHRPPAKWNKLMLFLETINEFRNRYAPDMQLNTRTICTNPDDYSRWRTVLEARGWNPTFRDWCDLPGSEKNQGKQLAGVKNELCEFVQLRSIFVDYDGTVIPCCSHPRAAVLGNLTEQTYTEIRSGIKRKEFLKKLKSSRIQMPICGQCNVSPLESKLKREWNHFHRKYIAPLKNK